MKIAEYCSSHFEYVKTRLEQQKRRIIWFTLHCKLTMCLKKKAEIKIGTCAKQRSTNATIRREWEKKWNRTNFEWTNEHSDAWRTTIILSVEKAEPKSIPKEKEKEERTRVENMKSKISREKNER